MDILALIALIIIGMVIITLPIYISAKIVSRKASFGRALIAAFLGPLIFYVTFVIVGALTLLVYAIMLPIAFIVALIMLIFFYSAIFDTSFLGGLLIAIIAVIISFIVLLLLGTFSYFAVNFPGGRRFGLTIIGALFPGFLPPV